MRRREIVLDRNAYQRENISGKNFFERSDLAFDLYTNKCPLKKKGDFENVFL